MRLFFLALLITSSFALSAQARNLPVLTGTLTWKGEFSSVHEVDRQVVRGLGEKQRERLKELKTLGYTCEMRASQTNLCSRFRSNVTLPKTIESSWKNQLKHLSFEVLEVSKGSNVITEGESYSEYEVYQTVRFNGRAWPSYRVMVLPNVMKVVLGVPGGEYHSFVVENNGLHYWAQTRANHSHGWTEYQSLFPLR